jgi:hypothetical protein
MLIITGDKHVIVDVVVEKPPALKPVVYLRASVKNFGHPTI